MTPYIQQIDDTIVALASIYDRADRRGAELAKEAGRALTRLRVHLSGQIDDAGLHAAAPASPPSQQVASEAATPPETVPFPSPLSSSSTEKSPLPTL